MALISEKAKLLKAISELEQPEKLKHLYSYAYYLNSYRRLPGDREPKDLVHSAIELLMTGRRQWDTVKCPNLIVLMKGIIKSLWSHSLEEAYYSTRVQQSGEDTYEVDVDSLQSKKDTAEKLLFSELKSEIEAVITGDDELMELYFAILEGYDKPRDIAKYLELDVKEVNVRYRRLRRKLKRHLKHEV